MATNYMEIISTNYPNVGCFCNSDPTVYSNIIWQNGDPLPSKNTLDAAALPFYQASTCDLVDAYRQQIQYGGYTDSSSTEWDSAPDDIANLSGICTLIACGAVTTSQTWRDANNVNHTLTPTQLVTLGAELAVFAATCYGVAWTHKGNINALTDVASVQSYDYTTGWPAN